MAEPCILSIEDSLKQQLQEAPQAPSVDSAPPASPISRIESPTCTVVVVGGADLIRDADGGTTISGAITPRALCEHHSVTVGNVTPVASAGDGKQAIDEDSRQRLLRMDSHDSDDVDVSTQEDQHHLQQQTQQQRQECPIMMETPAVDRSEAHELSGSVRLLAANGGARDPAAGPGGKLVIIREKLATAKPKRLSDEFFSADDDNEDDEEEEEDEDREEDEERTSSCVQAIDDVGDCDANASLNEIKNLSITGSSSGENVRRRHSRHRRPENGEDDEETASTSSQPLGGGGGSGDTAEDDDEGEEENVAPNEEDDELLLDDVQSMDAIERRDFEQEQRLTGGFLLRNRSLISADRLNLEFINTIHNNNQQQPSSHDGPPAQASSSHHQPQASVEGLAKHQATDEVEEASFPAADELEENGLEEIVRSSPTPSTGMATQLTTTPTSSRYQYKHDPHQQQQQHRNGVTSGSSNGKIDGDSFSSSYSRTNENNSTTKRAVNKLTRNLSASLANCSKDDGYDGVDAGQAEDATEAPSNSLSSSVSSLASSLHESFNGASGKGQRQQQQQQPSDVFLNANSNDSLSSEQSVYVARDGMAEAKTAVDAESGLVADLLPHTEEIIAHDPCSSSSASYSSSSSPAPSQTQPHNSDVTMDGSTSSSSSILPPTASLSSAMSIGPGCSSGSPTGAVEKRDPQSTQQPEANGCPSSGSSGSTTQPSTSSAFSCPFSKDVKATNSKSATNDAAPAAGAAAVAAYQQCDASTNTSNSPESSEPEIDEEDWADCEEGTDEEVCTCRDYTDEDGFATSEDELPSRDVDLSSYTQLDAISEDLLPDAQTPRLHRKRKLTENRNLFGDTAVGSPSANAESLNYTSRKRLALDAAATSTAVTSGAGSLTVATVTTPRSSTLRSPMNMATTPTSSVSGERKTPRTIIPTKDNPPPELNEWLLQFQRWTHVERLVAVDRLIEHCEPTQVRHMMKVIEPQFQRDFISLLPKELALQVLSYLDPKDLLRAAQTCSSWRFLADDNLLWKEKCKASGIVVEPSTDRPKRGRTGNMPPISSPWKAAYMRQHIIEMNWRSRPIRTAKVLKGHDDHVITCLQFCGNRIVSGSDDNTLKVWSAITGKCLRTLTGHTGGVWSSQMAGNIIISGSTDRTLRVWNAETGQCMHILHGHTSTVRCMHLHGNKVVSGSRDATLRVWDVNLGTCLHMLVGHLAAVRCVQYDGKLIVSGAYDYMVKVWNPERQECLHTLQGHTNRVYSLQFDGVHVVSGSLDTSIRVWDAETGSCKHALMGHQSLTSGMELRQNILVSGNADSTVKVWDIITGQCLQTLSGPNKHQSAVTCLQFNTRFVITSSDDGTVKLWDVKTGDFIRNLVALESGGTGGVVWRIRANDTKLICAVGSRNGTEETKLMVLDFDVEGACLKCS
ncbi:F-box/WD repeat-containing protein 7 [Anopheles bellator]|uniref:F-box/WD repeat-containing protein 7 n=1 Tax=Anopheles bellator TaxID=139047 RepID=UPI002648861D|nr:F-box/WD repeat-containing protein 7 [Anopheles bellator]